MENKEELIQSLLELRKIKEQELEKINKDIEELESKIKDKGLLNGIATK